MDEFATLYLELFAKFLRTIDRAISVRLLRRIPPREVTLTDELLAAFDSASRLREAPQAEHGFQAAERALRSRFGRTSDGGPKPLEFAIEMFDHGGGFEGQVSNVDVGLLIETGIRGAHDYSSKVYLLQAKRIRHVPAPGEDRSLGLRSGFRSLNAEQHMAMLYYEQVLSLDAFRYMYYMPEREFVDPSYARSDRWDVLDGYGIWTGRVMPRMSINPSGIYEAHRTNTAPLMALVLAHVARSIGDRSTASSLLGGADTDIVYPSGQDERDDLAHSLVSGDRTHLAALLDRLGIGPVAYAPVPRAVLRLRLPSPTPELRPSGGPRRRAGRGFPR